MLSIMKKKINQLMSRYYRVYRIYNNYDAKIINQLTIQFISELIIRGQLFKNIRTMVSHGYL